MISTDFDVIVVGTGPAGVSAAYPLVEAGLKVLLIDGGKTAEPALPSGSYLTNRREDPMQWKWMVGHDYHALKNLNSVSPKLRVPTHAHVFEGFVSATQITTDNFVAVGSLARGGLSNAWGCGVARLSAAELEAFPFPPKSLDVGYEATARRMGISGATDDALSGYFGLDAWADPPIPLDGLNTRLIEKYQRIRLRAGRADVLLGRSRVAALSRDRGERKACNLSGNCMWGCERQSLYSATTDLKKLRQFENLTYRSGFVVNAVSRSEDQCAVNGSGAKGAETLTSTKLILAAGTLATTRLALAALSLYDPVPLQSSPTAAFMLWLPAALGTARVDAFGLGQLSFTLPLKDDMTGFGSLFSTNGIPIAEFSRYMPFAKRFGIDILSTLMSSCLVGNVFLPGKMSTTMLAHNADGRLAISGSYRGDMPEVIAEAERKLRTFFWGLGAVMLPKSFKLSAPGSDIHYAATLPMQARPQRGQTSAFGELYGLKGIYIADGASLPSVSEKSHTLTIMANAMRIGSHVAQSFKTPQGPE